MMWWNAVKRSAAVAGANAWLRKARAVAGRLAADREELDRLLDLLGRSSAKVEGDLAAAADSLKNQEDVVKALQSEVKILEECVVVPLEAANARLREHWKTETQIEVLKRVAAEPAAREMDV